MRSSPRLLREPSQCALAQSRQQVPRSAGGSGSSPGSDPVSGSGKLAGEEGGGLPLKVVCLFTQGACPSQRVSLFSFIEEK